MAIRSTLSKSQSIQRRGRPTGKTVKTGKYSRVVGSKHQTTKDPRIDFTDDEWHDMVATAAYYRAEARGFTDGSSDEDWYEAEAELRERLTKAEKMPDIEESSASRGEARA